MIRVINSKRGTSSKIVEPVKKTSSKKKKPTSRKKKEVVKEEVTEKTEE